MCLTVLGQHVELDMIALTPEENSIVQSLTNKGLAPASAALSVVMATREHSRPEAELADIVRQYQGLELPDEALSAIRDLKQRGWIEPYDTYGQTILRQATGLRGLLADFLGDKNAKDTLKKIRSSVDPVVRIRGSMNDEEVYLSYLELLKTAQSEICLPMLATTPKLESVPILQERARKGVKVKVLLAAPHLVATLRGETMRRAAVEAIRGWTIHSKDIPAFEVRVVQHLCDTYIATCMCIDGRLLRLDVYDPFKQRSLQGTLIEFECPQNLDLNVVRLFRDRFDEAWNRAKPAGLWWLPCWWFSRSWRWCLFVLFSILAWNFAKKPVALGVFSSAAASFLFTA